MSDTEWVKEHTNNILVAFIVVVVILLFVLPTGGSSGMADLCVRRQTCVHECCPAASGFKSIGRDGVASRGRDDILAKIRGKLRL